MRFAIAVIAFSFNFYALSVFAQSSSPPEEITKKFNEFNAYKPIDGVWEGEYFIKSSPEILTNDFIKDGNKAFRVGLRLSISGKQAKVQFQFKPNGTWTESNGAALLIPDQLGWHVLIARNGGAWFERVFISVARLSENEGAVTVTRTVHNWYAVGSSNAPDFYSVFGEGAVKKI